MRYRYNIVFFLISLLNSLVGQISNNDNDIFKWEYTNPTLLTIESEKYSENDLVILNEKTEFYFYATDNEKVIKNYTVKLNTQKGVDSFKTLVLPESFDIAKDAGLYKQGRKSKLKIPFISDFKVVIFACRKLVNNKWEDVTYKTKYDKLRWIKYTGEFIDDETTTFNIQNLLPGDIVEVYYKLNFSSNYGSNLFYFYSKYPKIRAEYNFIYKVNNRYADYEFVLPVNISDSLISKTKIPYKDFSVLTTSIKIKDIQPVNYPEHSMEQKQFPHVFADFKFYRVMSGSYPNGSERVYEYDLFRPKKFEWIIFNDTTNQFTKIYDKQFASIRKFISSFPVVGNDSFKVQFFKALCDTFNNFKFINSNHLFYNESSLYNLYSGDHLLKRRLIEHLMWKLYTDILNENKLFYYVANIEDKRYGEHTLQNRAHYAYENYLISIPIGNTYIYFMPRYGGVKYHLNELPFYYEESLAALFAKNYQEEVNNKNTKGFKIIKTHKGTFNENTRTENGTVKINTDSLKYQLLIKESLSGQYSTILRHLYSKDNIDSTISIPYFKKCTDKPNLINEKIKVTSKITEFPFRYNYLCSGSILQQEKNILDLKNWFSFIISNTTIPQVPSHDYYFDFEFTDSYTYLLNFDKPVALQNISDFNKKIANDYYELECEIIKNSEMDYLLKVRLIVKQLKLPKENSKLLMDLVSDLDYLNNFKFYYSLK